MSKQKGFTLLETIIAMVIMSAAIVLLATSWGGSFMRIRKTQQQFEVSSLIERKMGEIERRYRGKPLEEIPDEAEEDFGEEYPQFSWRLKSKKFEMPDIASTLTAKEGGADQMTSTMIKQMSDVLGKSIKEVTLTVISKHANKNLEYSVTTYFIDYSKELPAMGMPQ